MCEVYLSEFLAFLQDHPPVQIAVLLRPCVVKWLDLQLGVSGYHSCQVRLIDAGDIRILGPVYQWGQLCSK